MKVLVTYKLSGALLADIEGDDDVDFNAEDSEKQLKDMIEMELLDEVILGVEDWHMEDLEITSVSNARTRELIKEY